MKRIISLSLAVLMLLTLILTATSCGMESMTGFTRLRDHLIDKVGTDQLVTLDAAAAGVSSASVAVVERDDGVREVRAVGYIGTQSAVYQVLLVLDGSVEKATLIYQVLQTSDGQVVAMADATVHLNSYTGEDLVVFDSVEAITASYEMTHRQNATVLLNSLLLGLDTYIRSELDMSVSDLGFVVLSDKYMADVGEAVTEDDLGGAFSGARLGLAGRMIIQGMGMVFLVLAILWLVLIIFKKLLYKDPAKQNKEEKKPEEKKEPAPAPVVATAPAPATDDGALVAAITAAIAATIESDPALASQFAGGFRVVSFKKKSGKTAWNR